MKQPVRSACLPQGTPGRVVEVTDAAAPPAARRRLLLDVVGERRRPFHFADVTVDVPGRRDARVSRPSQCAPRKETLGTFDWRAVPGCCSLP